MPVFVDWLDERHSAIVQAFHGRWTLEEFLASVASVDVLLDTVHQPVDLIADVTRSGMPPLGIVAAAEKVISPDRRHRNVQRVVYVAPSPFMRMLLASARRVSPEYRDFLYEFPSLSAATAFLDGKAHTDK